MNSDALEEILVELKELIDEAHAIVRKASRSAPTSVMLQRAERYWLAQLKTALDSEHDYLGGCMFTMKDTIEDIKELENIAENCPSCGAPPGAPLTEDCDDGDGCGYYRWMENEGQR